MDPIVGMGMIFSVVVLAMVGGFILMYPLTRRLADILERRMVQEGQGPDPEQVAALTRAVEALRDEVDRLSERQDFTERLLEKPREGSR